MIKGGQKDKMNDSNPAKAWPARSHLPTHSQQCGAMLQGYFKDVASLLSGNKNKKKKADETSHVVKNEYFSFRREPH